MTQARRGGDVAEWAMVIAHLGLRWGESVLVLGEDADLFARAYRGAGAPPVAHEDSRLAYLSKGDPPDGLDAADPSSTSFAAESVDLVVLRHAVPDQVRLIDALEEAYRILRPGGGMLASDVNLDAMTDSSTFRYPSRLQYDLFPGLLEREAVRHVDGADLDVEMVRAGFREVDGHDVAHLHGRFPDHADYLEFVRRHGWRSFDLLAPEQVERVLDELHKMLPSLAPTGEVLEREPWHVTRGVKPA